MPPGTSNTLLQSNIQCPDFSNCLQNCTAKSLVYLNQYSQNDDWHGGACLQSRHWGGWGRRTDVGARPSVLLTVSFPVSAPTPSPNPLNETKFYHQAHWLDTIYFLKKTKQNKKPILCYFNIVQWPTAFRRYFKVPSCASQVTDTVLVMKLFELNFGHQKPKEGNEKDTHQFIWRV